MGETTTTLKIKVDRNEAKREIEMMGKDFERLMKNSKGGGGGSVAGTAIGTAIGTSIGGFVSGAFNRIPGNEEISRLLGEFAAPELTEAKRRIQAPISALDQTIQAFGPLGKNADPDAIRSFYDAVNKIETDKADGELGVRKALQGSRLNKINEGFNDIANAAQNDVVNAVDRFKNYIQNDVIPFWKSRLGF